MTIRVNGGNGASDFRTYDIASVYSYMVQQGGGGLAADGVCTAYSYYGYEGLTIDNAVKAAYTLKYTDADGKIWYYNQEGGLSEAVEKTTQGFMGPVTALAAPDDAEVYDAMGRDGCDVQFIVNTLFVKTRIDQTEEKTVDGKQIVFAKEYTSGQIGSWDGVSLAPGYVRTSGFSPNQQWAWSRYYGSGWSPELSVIPTTVPYTDGPFGEWAERYAPSAGGPGGLGPGAGDLILRQGNEPRKMGPPAPYRGATVPLLLRPVAFTMCTAGSGPRQHLTAPGSLVQRTNYSASPVRVPKQEWHHQ